MEHDYIHSLAPSNLGLDKITAEDIRNNPKLADIIINQRDKGDENYHVLTNALIDKDKEIALLECELKKSQSLATRISVSSLNLFGALCTSIGTADLTSLTNQIILGVGVLMVLTAAVLNIFCRKIG